jgi:DegV family protein with EDD domain
VSKVAIVMDSTCDLPEEIVQQYGIYTAPMAVTWDRVKYRDGVDLKVQDFYKRLRTSETFPSTSSGITGEFLQIYESLRGKVESVVTICLTSGIGISFNSANQAKEMVPELKIEVVDSQMACAGEGWAALEAARMAEKGASLEQVASRARAVAAKSHEYFLVDDIEYMRRGGRISMLTWPIEELQKAKPVLGVLGGKFVPVAKPPTTEEGIETLLGYLKENATDKPLHVSIEHGDNLKTAEIVKKAIISQYKIAEVYIVGFSPVIGSHFGPGAVGIGFYNE